MFWGGVAFPFFILRNLTILCMLKVCKREKAPNLCQRELLSATENTAPALPEYLVWSRAFSYVTYI